MKRALHIVILLLILRIVAPAQVDTVYICNPGDPVQLQATEGLYAYTWFPFSTLDNSSIYNPIASPFESQTYIVEQLTAASNIDNLILNPSFEEGNDFFSSDYTFVEKINRAGTYGVNESAFNLNPDFFTDCPDHTTGDGPMLIVDGAPQTNQEVWCQSVLVQPNTSYAFSAWLTSVKRENPANLQFYINDQALGASFRAADMVCQWRQFYEIWESDTTDIARICIINQNENPQGNDFALDDFGLYELASVTYDTTVVLIESIAEAQIKRIYKPTVFSPNNDGINDLFFLPTGKGVARIEDFRIYNRWGNKVFERSNCEPNDPTCMWDGSIDGVHVATDIHTYIGRVIYADQTSETIHGDVSIIR